MIKNLLTHSLSNFFAITLLLAIISLPLYFAKNFAQVSGLKNQTDYLVTSQIDKFPNLSLAQNGDEFQVTLEKYPGASAAFLGILQITNPTNTQKKYQIKNLSSGSEAFFGEDSQDRQIEITLPPTTTTPLSVFSSKESQAGSVTFSIVVLK